MNAYAAQQRRTLIFVILFFILLATTIAAIGYRSYRNFETQTRAETETWLNIVSGVKADAVNAWHADLLDFANLIQQDRALDRAIASAIQNAPAPQAPAQILAELEVYAQRDETGLIEALDPQGKRLAAIPAPASFLDPSILQKISEARASAQITFAGFYRDSDTDEIYIAILVPLPRGTIVIRIDPRVRLYPILEKQITETPSIQTYLAQAEAGDALLLTPLPYNPDAPLRLRVPLQQPDSLEALAVKGETGMIEGADYRGVAMIADARPVSEGWVLISQTSLSKMRDSISVYFGRTILVSGTMVFYTGLGLALIWRQQQLKRYQAETKAAQDRATELDIKVRERTDELSALSRQMAEMHEKQIRDLARELHDGVGQNLTAINLNLSLLRQTLPDLEAETTRPLLANTSQLVEETVARMRNVMADFLPPMLEHYGLTPALNWYAEQFARRTALQVRVNDLRSDPARLDSEVEVGLFRITQEALNNIAKHARASRVEIELNDEAGVMRLAIRDDGAGFDPQAIHPDAAHWGFAIMRERARALEAAMEIHSAPNAGTQIILRMSRKA
ncbi:MAG: hypothetical protein HFACDABA_02711 [Anaerolineales bacterium]|nr:hypothetical protein [Anaerolineales bacterium]